MRVLIALLLASCQLPKWPAGTSLDPIGPGDWPTTVSLAVARWNAAVRPYCQHGELLSVTDGGKPVRWIAAASWTFDPKTIGYYTGRDIVVKDGDYDLELAILAHELGHALGLQHVTKETDPYSVMHPSSETSIQLPSRRDALLAARHQGCL